MLCPCTVGQLWVLKSSETDIQVSLRTFILMVCALCLDYCCSYTVYPVFCILPCQDGAYEEIQELPQKSDSGTALKTVYVTADFPTNPSSASHHYSAIFAPNSSVSGGGDPCISVTDNGQPPMYSTVNHPSGPKDPFYCTATMKSPGSQNSIHFNYWVLFKFKQVTDFRNDKIYWTVSFVWLKIYAECLLW